MPLFSCFSDPSTASQDGRPLSLHERYAYVTHNIRDPYTIVILYTYPLDALPTIDLLSKRINDLQALWPGLYAEIRNGQTRKPRLAFRSHSWPSEAILREVDLRASQASPPSEKDKDEREVMIKDELQRMKKRCNPRNPTGPYWQVSRIVPSAAKGDSQRRDQSDRALPALGTKGYILISAYHWLLDGTGLLNLSQAILDSSLDGYKPEAGLPARLEDMVPIKPSARFVIPQALDEFVVCKLPSSVRRKVQETPSWPGEIPSLHSAGRQNSSGRICEKAGDVMDRNEGSNVEHREGHLVIDLPPDIVPRLKAAGKLHGIQTLHPILEAAWMVAQWAALDQPSAPLVCSTPKSERSPDLGAPHALGVYPSAFHVRYPPLRPSARFWDLASLSSRVLTDPKERSKARMYIGTLALVPDSPSFRSQDPLRPTKWEDFFLERLTAAVPYHSAVVVSNLGFAKLPPGCDDMVWDQSACPLEHPLAVSIAGHKAGLRATVAWREGQVLVTRQVELMADVYVRVLRRLSELEGDLAKESVILDNLITEDQG